MKRKFHLKQEFPLKNGGNNDAEYYRHYDVLELIKANPIKFHKYQKFDNGRGIGRYYANLIRQMKR